MEGGRELTSHERLFPDGVGVELRSQAESSPDERRSSHGGGLLPSSRSSLMRAAEHKNPRSAEKKGILRSSSSTFVKGI
jgi:hypothetical protein